MTAGIEGLLNAFLYRLASAEISQNALQEKYCVKLKGFSTPLNPVFSETAVLMCWGMEGEGLYVVITKLAFCQNYAIVKAVGRALPAAANWKCRAIFRSCKIFVAPADLAEFDPAELLAPYTGDIAAESASAGRARRG